VRLNVRREQIDVMASVAEANFERDLAAHLRANYASSIVRLPHVGEVTVHDLVEDNLQRLVRIGIAKARRYELTRQSSIAGFVVTMFSVSPNFDENRLCQVMLSDEEKSPDDRADEIANVLSENNWDAIRNDYDPEAWVLPEAERESETVSTAQSESAADDGKGDDPMARTVTGKTLSRISKMPKESVGIQPEVPVADPDLDRNTMKIDRKN
jgi:hypothetical protein